MKVAGWVGIALTVLFLLPLAMVLAVAAVLVPAAVAPISCGDRAAAAGATSAAPPGKPPTESPRPVLPPSVARGAGEGGIGFPLPPPGRPRQDSLHNPPLPIPARIERLYRAAAKRYRIPWTLLAGVGMAETGHGRNNRVSWAGAQGLMQFLPATFAAMGVDGNRDGRAEIGSDADSVFSAANYLTRSGVSEGAAGVRRALRAYNRPAWYTNDVLFYAAAYGGGTVYGNPHHCGTTTRATGGRPVPPLTAGRVAAVLRFATSRAGGPYVMGANGPRAYDCSSLTQTAYARAGIRMPRTAAAQRSWLAAGNGTRIPLGQEQPGDLVFWDSYLGSNQIGHVMLVWNPATKTTIEARSTRDGIGHFSYADGPSHHIFEIWRAANLTSGS
ncbi:NlpC/P60 family protein [Friedmanniella luteola]|uniref:NlpC/P60 family protein n=1 Tax=Friedmanniella luteola TaxID=546871 RepID=A0A1H1WS28_9ACTN|nr:lytic murein transglycosylase [Friedmanniella luteola]SDS99832.1 NlpC/P60 family protein [Friedmanniella luteola]